MAGLADPRTTGQPRCPNQRGRNTIDNTRELALRIDTSELERVPPPAECQTMSGVSKSPAREIGHVLDALELNAISQACESDKAGVEPPTIYRHRLIHRAPR
jgi:hypothetical protein